MVESTPGRGALCVGETAFSLDFSQVDVPLSDQESGRSPGGAVGETGGRSSRSLGHEGIEEGGNDLCVGAEGVEDHGFLSGYP